MSLPVTTTPQADAQIRAIDDWWRENRPASPDLFLELSVAFEVIGRALLYAARSLYEERAPGQAA